MIKVPPQNPLKSIPNQQNIDEILGADQGNDSISLMLKSKFNENTQEALTDGTHFNHHHHLNASLVTNDHIQLIPLEEQTYHHPIILPPLKINASNPSRCEHEAQQPSIQVNTLFAEVTASSNVHTLSYSHSIQQLPGMTKEKRFACQTSSEHSTFSHCIDDKKPS